MADKWFQYSGDDITGEYGADQGGKTLSQLPESHADVIAFRATQVTDEAAAKKCHAMPITTTADRPSASDHKGCHFFDDTLGIPVYSDGTDWRKFSDDTTT